MLQTFVSLLFTSSLFSPPFFPLSALSLVGVLLLCSAKLIFLSKYIADQQKHLDKIAESLQAIEKAQKGFFACSLPFSGVQCFSCSALLVFEISYTITTATGLFVHLQYALWCFQGMKFFDPMFRNGKALQCLGCVLGNHGFSWSNVATSYGKSVCWL